jgi:signal transduction histidine kinase
MTDTHTAPSLPVMPPPASGPDGPANAFLQGGGEMGARMRAFDWGNNTIGTPASWPQSLKTIVRVMLDSRYAMWMLWGPQKTFFCNDAYLPTVGLKRDWVLGAPADEVWAEIWPDIGPRIEQVLQQGQATWDEALLLFLERSGFTEESYHTFSYSPVYDDENRVAGMLCVVTEVTERVVGERRLRMLHDLAARAIGSIGIDETCRRACEVIERYAFDMPFAALYLGGAGGTQLRRVACTASSQALAIPLDGASAAAASPWPIRALLDSQATQTLHGLPRRGIQVAAGPWPDAVQQALLLPLKAGGAGLVGCLAVGCSPRQRFDDKSQSFFELVAGQIDAAIADAQAYEAERRRAEALAELDRAKTTFFSNVSHEFRTPLTLLLGPLEEAIVNDRVPDAVRERLELAQRNAVRLQRLVSSLLDFSRIEAGRGNAYYESTDLAALTRDLASTFRSAMERAGLDFAVNCPPLDEPAFVDREMWEKIVLNLLSNAFKFTLEGYIAVRLRTDDGHALLEVRDSGSGIPAHELPRLFERFHRVEGTRSRTHEGSGIGLALVSELVKLHAGRIEVDSVVGQGTCFRVRIPLGSAHLAPDRIRGGAVESTPNLAAARSFVDEALRWLPDADGAGAAPVQLLASDLAPTERRFASAYGARVLLADDNADMRVYVRELLAPYYVVEAVADGQQALAAARREPPDLIVSDVMMPRLDGFGLLAAVRADEALRSVPVVLLSARAGQEARIEGLDSGADDYVIKPFSARELLARLGSLLELRRMRRDTDEAFRLRTAQFETLLNEAPLGVFLLDAQLRFREANPTTVATFDGIPGLIGMDFGEAVHRLWPAALADEASERVRGTLATGQSYYTPEWSGTRLTCEQTEYYEWQINRIPLPDGGLGVVSYFRDVSPQVRARTLLQTADRQKDEFLAMLAHELRNPLAPIRNAGEILLRVCAGNERALQAVGIVQRQVANLTRLVDDLLDMSRITRGRVELQIGPVPLADVVAQAVETVEHLLRDKRHDLSITTHGAVRVLGDPARLVQCVSNLLNNAAKYTDAGGRIALEVRAQGDVAVLVVADNGMGIPKELQASVFDLFVQGDRTLDRALGGLGIGLSVVKRLIEMHGGSVSVSSPGFGGGSVFEVRLPLLKNATVRDALLPSVRVRPGRILVVDDNVDAADSLAMILSLDGHQVRCAYAAREAIALARSFQPDVALVDIGLPEMDGYQLAGALRSEADTSHIRLLALTGYGRQQADPDAGRDPHFDAYLVKPPDLAALQQALSRAIA